MGFCAPLHFFTLSFFLSGYLDNVQCSTPLSLHSYSFSPPSISIRELPMCVCVCVCVCDVKGACAVAANSKQQAAPAVQRQVHVLKCGPWDGTYYPCPLHQQGPWAGAGSWPFVSKQMEMGRGGERKGGKKRMERWQGRGGRKESQSVLINSGIEGDVAPHNASAAVDSPSLIQAHAPTICTVGTSQGVCACISQCSPIWQVKMRYSLGFYLVKIFQIKLYCLCCLSI